MKFNHWQNSFSYGEISPELYGRVNDEHLLNSVSFLENFYPKIQGGISFREGFITHITGLLDSENFVSSLIPFTVSKQEAYLIRIDVIEKVGVEISGGLDFLVVPNVLDNYSFDTMTSVEPLYLGETYGLAGPIDPHGWSYVQYGYALFACHSSGLIPPLIIRLVGNEFYYFIYGKTFTGEGSILSGHPALSVNKFLWTPYLPANLNSSSTVTVDTTNSKITATQPIFPNHTEENINAGEYKTNHENFQRDFYIRVNFGSEDGSSGVFFGQCYVDSGNPNHNGTEVALRSGWVSDGTITGATPYYQLEAWGGANGYPRTVTMYQQRLVFANTPTRPDTIWASATGQIFQMMSQRINSARSGLPDNFLSFTGTSQEDDPFDFFIADNYVNHITWLSANIDLLVGTLSGEHYVSFLEGALSSKNSFVNTVSKYGGQYTNPATTENGVIFISRDGKSLMETIRVDEKIYNTNNIQFTNQEIIYHNYDLRLQNEPQLSRENVYIKKIAWNPSNNVIYVLTSLGELFGVLKYPRVKIASYFRISYGKINPKDFIYDMELIPNEDGTEYFLWLMYNEVEAIDTYTSFMYMHQKFDNVELNSISFDLKDYPTFLDIGNLVFLIGDVSGVLRYDDSLVWDNGFTFESYFDNTSHYIGQPIVLDSITPDGGSSAPPELSTGVTYYLSYVNPQKWMLCASVANALNFIPITVTPFSGTCGFNSDTPEGDTKLPAHWFPEGQVVHYIQDGIYGGTLTVNNRVIETPTKHENYVYYGLLYEGKLKLNDIFTGNQIPTTGYGNIKRIDRLWFMLYKSKNCEFGESLDRLDSIPFDFTVEPTKVETKRIREFFPGNPDEETDIWIRNNKPLPLSVTSLVIRGELNE
jgi:hypothetical protein